MKCLLCEPYHPGQKEIKREMKVDYICSECGAEVRAIKRCHKCKKLGDKESIICPRCGNPDIVECYVQSFGLTESGKEVAGKLSDEAQVESLLEEVKS